MIQRIWGLVFFGLGSFGFRVFGVEGLLGLAKGVQDFWSLGPLGF